MYYLKFTALLGLYYLPFRGLNMCFPSQTCEFIHLIDSILFIEPENYF